MKHIANIPEDKVLNTIIGPETGIEIHEIDGTLNISQEYGDVTMTLDQWDAANAVIRAYKKRLQENAK